MPVGGTKLCGKGIQDKTRGPEKKDNVAGARGAVEDFCQKFWAALQELYML